MSIGAPRINPTPLMEEPGASRHVEMLERRLASGLTTSYTTIDAARIAHYAQRGRDLRARWWTARLKALFARVTRPHSAPGANLRPIRGNESACCR